MQKVRVFQLAKELKVQSALILELLDRLGSDINSDLSIIDAKTADVVRTKITLALEVETKRLIEARDETVADEVVAEAPATTEIDEAAKPAATDEAPVTDETPGTPVVPAGVTEPPAAPQPIAARPAETTAPRTQPPEQPRATGAPATSSGPQMTPSGKRVFPARRIPSAEMLARARARTATVGRPSMGRDVTQPRPGTPPQGFPPRPGGAPGRPGYAPPKRRKKRDRGKDAQRQPMVAMKPKADLPPVPETITLSEGVSVKELADKLNRKSKDVIAKLLSRGVLATINQPLDPKTAIDVAKEFGSTATIMTFEEEAQAGTTEATEPGGVVIEVEEDDSANMLPRPPVVTVMGHVDHGKTSLLDAVRSANVADREAGGITQHIAAYQVSEKGRMITFLDTPGHEAFTMMRARGAKATDIVVLVVAADDGVKPQTKEAIDHSNAAGVPMVVAINKIDKSNANVDRVKQQLAENEVMVEEYGGSVVTCEVSAKKRDGIDNLLDMILLQSDMQELKANPDRPGAGVVLEARRDRSRGILATVLVQNGTLKAGDAFIAGSAYGKVRAMTDQYGKRIAEAKPSTPVEVMGFATEPKAGDTFQAVTNEAKARQIASFRQEKAKVAAQRANVRTTLEAFSQSVGGVQSKELRILLRGDVQGSLEALEKSLGELPSDKIKVKVLRSSIGGITQADILLASASNALIVGFNVRPDRTAADLAKQEGIEIRLYSVIYNLLDDIKQAMLGMLEPTLKETVIGQATVREPFKIPKIGVIAGCLVTDGKVTRGADVRLLRDNVVVYTGRVGSLRRFKDDVSEVKNGYECGIGIAGYNDIKPNDVIEFFIIEKIAQKSL